MTFLIDENIPRAVHGLLAEFGHDVIDIRGTPLQGADDRRLFELAQERAAILLTTDRDFYHTIPLQFPQHHGVIVIALKQPNRAAILARIRWVVERELVNELADTVLLLRDTTYRIRRNTADD